MLLRIMLVIALAIVVGFGVSLVFEQGNLTPMASHAGQQFDAVLGRNPALSASARWFDSPFKIGLVAGGTVYVVGVVVTAFMQPKTP